MRATRLSLMVLLVVLAFVLWNAAWVTDRCGEWTAALDEAEAALAQGGSGQQQLDALTTLWQEPQAGCGAASRDCRRPGLSDGP